MALDNGENKENENEIWRRSFESLEKLLETVVMYVCAMKV